MKAAQITEYGDASVIHINEVATPVPAAGQVQVAVRASSLNPFDSAVLSGAVQQMIPLHFPATLGGDIAGEVTVLGEGVSGLAVGDKVYGQAAVVAGNSGALAEFAATSAGEVGRMPENLDFMQAASLPLVGVSAIEVLIDHIKLSSGQKIFIHGGAGGIGSIAIQLAKHLGATVATTATGEDMAYVKSLGADQVIDYKTEDFSTILKDFDAVHDTVGGDDFNKALPILKRGGTAVSMIAKADEAKVNELGVMAITQSTKVTTEKLDQLRELVESGAIKPQVTKTFPLDQIVEAFQAREAGGVRGKIVITI